ncbi:CLUMA_CG005009, isoform A [Clunio marinus]|uniref:CLUMA_CG005009, isoform A n=1 Tax=Clunio marinus TaxID=568069 RepID=A0A1J1HTF0_9DIPT|nr:CLUMA_CG005009, isoform A [Clunio marinus]
MTQTLTNKYQMYTKFGRYERFDLCLKPNYNVTHANASKLISRNMFVYEKVYILAFLSESKNETTMLMESLFGAIRLNEYFQTVKLYDALRETSKVHGKDQ